MVTCYSVIMDTISPFGGCERPWDGNRSPNAALKELEMANLAANGTGTFENKILMHIYKVKFIMHFHFHLVRQLQK